jgi:hypothetical protein
MNRELLTRYHSLSSDERKFIRNKASESPVLLKLLNFLDSCKEQNFTTLSAVRAIYPEEVAHVPFPKLRNRFFKIRKELLSFRSEIQPEQAGTLTGHPLEIQFIPHGTISALGEGTTIITIYSGSFASKTVTVNVALF